MNEELAEKLNADFPYIFKGHCGSVHSFGFECGSGWFQIIYDLCVDLSTIAKKEGYEPPVAVQVKEKFGGLRFYIDGSHDEYEDRIREAEVLSEQTCEVCGRKGKIRRNMWIQTLCDKHANTSN